MPLQPKRINIPISGGLAQDETPEYLDPPALYQCDNFYHDTKTSLTKRNGYDAIPVIVDSRNSAWDMSVPFTGQYTAAIDRFIDTGDSVTFAARGWLWTYAPLVYAGATGLDPKPNTIRHSEIPDLQVIRETTASIDTPSWELEFEDCASAVSVSGTRCDTWIRANENKYEWWGRIFDPATGIAVSEVLFGTYDQTIYHPGVASYNGGFLVMVGDAAGHQILVQRYRFSTADWVPQTFPTLMSDDVVPSVMHPQFYDVCGTNSNVVCFAVIIPTVEYGTPDFYTVYNALFAFTLDAESLTVTHGPFRMGDRAGKTAGCSGVVAPTFAVAGKKTGDCGVVWFQNTEGKLYFRSFLGDNVRAAVELGDGTTSWSYT